jgi:predicted acyl esterase
MRLRSYRSAELAVCMVVTALTACSNQRPQPTMSGTDIETAGMTAVAGSTSAAAGSGSRSTTIQSTRGQSSGALAAAGQGGAAPTAAAGGAGSAASQSDAGMPATMVSETPDAALAPQPSVRCADVMAEASSGPGSGYPGGKWTVPAATHGALVVQNVEIMMSDGVKLVGDVSYPADLQTRQRSTEQFPVLLTQNPYGAGVFGAEYGELFVTHGYIFASIDVRGTGRSAGTHDMFSPREAEDGAALVMWAAALQGSDGQVGLQGCSQLGINQLETATLLGANSPVKAMIPACASGDFYRDTAFDNGIPTIVGSLLAAPDSTEGGDMAYYREYWKTRDRLARAPAIAEANIPMLLWSGWHEPGALGSLELYAALQNLSAGRPVSTQITADLEINGRYQVILGDWAHAGGLDKGIELQWFDTWIKGVDTGIAKDTKTPLHLAELGGSKRWLSSSCYPLVERYQPLYLTSGEKLSMSAETTAGADMLDWTASIADTIEYTSEPFAGGALLAGPIAAKLRVSSSNTNLQLHIEVLDKAASGQPARISQGSILGSLRRTDPEQSWSDEASLPKRPYLTLDEEQPLTPGEATWLEVPLWPTVWSIEPGHSIAVRISTQPNSDSCADPLGVPVGCYPSNPMTTSLRGGSYQLQRGGEQGSLISLPLVEHGAYPTAASAVSTTGNMATPLPIDW